MRLTTGANSPGSDTLAAILALIAHSQLVLPQPRRDCVATSRSLPAGFDDIDLAVLQWIAAEGRRLGRRFAYV
jgi:hypothetical protein